MRGLFWETTLARIDLERDAQFVMARVLEFGRLRDVRWLLKQYDLEAIHNFLATSGHPELSKKTIAFWRAFLHAEGETWRSPPAFRRDSSAYWAS
jgi:hypothetical protein